MSSIFKIGPAIVSFHRLLFFSSFSIILSPSTSTHSLSPKYCAHTKIQIFNFFALRGFELLAGGDDPVSERPFLREVPSQIGLGMLAPSPSKALRSRTN
jgi:hypothetical protein